MHARLGLYAPHLPPAFGGLSDHTLACARALYALAPSTVLLGMDGQEDACAPVPCTFGVRPGTGPDGMAAAAKRLGLSAVLVEYVPFAYARFGLAPALVAGLGALRRQGIRVALFVHEPFVPATRPTWLLTSWPMRWQLRSLVRRSDVVYAAVPRFIEWMRRGARRETRLVLAPVGSNIPVTGEPRSVCREELGLAPADVALSVFSPAASGLRLDWILEAARALDGVAGLRWHIVGNGSERLPEQVPRGVAVRRHGRVDAGTASRALTATDLALQPYVDGLTLRRSGALAALAHGVALVSCTGSNFDPDTADGAACPETRDAFVATVRQLAGDTGARAALAERGRAFYERRASMRVLAQRIAEDLRIS